MSHIANFQLPKKHGHKTSEFDFFNARNKFSTTLFKILAFSSLHTIR